MVGDCLRLQIKSSNVYQFISCKLHVRSDLHLSESRYMSTYNTKISDFISALCAFSLLDKGAKNFSNTEMMSLKMPKNINYLAIIVRSFD